MKTQKPSYRIRNWKNYNAALVARGNLTFWFDEDVVNAWANKIKTGKRGRSPVYTDAAIQCMLTLKAVFRLSRAVMRGMMKARFGRIINITSVVGSAGNPGQANYAAAKAGVAGMSRALARELGSRNITVNCIAPGFIDTDMTRGLPEAQRDALLQQIPLGRLGRAEEIAGAVAFLASPIAGYITGTTLHVNGGMYLA